MGSLQSYLSRISTRIFLFVLGLVLLAAVIPQRILLNGINAPTAVGSYVNGIFPSTTPGQGTGNWILADAFPNLGFTLPVHMIPEPGTNRLLVAEMTGRIVAFDNNSTTSSTSTFLDINARTRYAGESGLLSFAFHPRFGIDSNYVYTFYTWTGAPGKHYIRLSRFDVPIPGGAADPNTELILIQQQDKNNSHQGGCLLFGDDGYLLITSGDEGGASNSYNTAQKIDERLFSGILRIDVDRNPLTSHPIRRQPVLNNATDQSYTANYFIPNDNPWLDPGGTILEEFYAIGLRNPHKIMKDPVSGTIFIGEVGQGIREEVNILYGGANYQWAFKEGLANGPNARPANVIGIETEPLHWYTHQNNNKCIIGGGVYRGSSFPTLYGKYLFADNVSKRIWSMDLSNITNPVVTELLTAATLGTSKNGISCFGYDANGELYILRMADNTSNGKIYKLATSNAGPPDPPALLSQLNIFSNLSSMTPHDYTIPYELNVPFWSDNAIKTRYMIVPNDGTHNTSAEQIIYSAEGEWELPEGALTIKHFEYPIDESNPSLTQKIETRILVQGTGNEFYGLSYRWNAAQTDADLLTTGLVDTIEIATPHGPRQVEWIYPSRAECLTCHTSLTKGVLGPQTAQLNRSTLYPQTGITANQLKTLTHLNIFDVAPDTNNLANNPTAPEILDQSAPINQRLLAYLNSNCGYCHRPGTGVLANFDCRYMTNNFISSILYKDAFNSLGLDGSRLIIPGDTVNSVLLERLQSVHEGYSMPPIAKNLMDSTGVSLVKEWIMSLDDTRGSVCESADFSSQSIQTYGGTEDQGQGYIQNGGNRILVENNGWKKIAYSYTLTANSVLEFDFASTQQAEEHSIGMDNDDTPDNNRFKLYGTENTSSHTNYNTYSGNGDYQHFIIPIGQFFTGTFSHLVFNSDNDASPTSGNSFFENILIHEGECDMKNYQKIDFPVIIDQDTAITSLSLGATSTSGLPVSYQVISGPASVSGNTLNLNGNSGYVVVEASQAGNGLFEAAPEVRRTFFVKPTGKAEGTGLYGWYYNKKDLTDSIHSQIDPQINFFWSNGRPAPQIDYSTFSMKWLGWIEPPFGGNYSFEITADDGVRVWIDSVLVIDEWRDQAATSYSATVNLTQWRKTPIRIEYYQNKVYAKAILKWTHANINKEVVPQRFLYPNIPNVLSATSIELTAREDSSYVELKWNTRDEKNVNRFVLQKSNNGINFHDIASRPSKGNTSFATYSSTDQHPGEGRLYYKVKMIDMDGSESYSNIESLFRSRDLAALDFRIYPNPSPQHSPIYLEIESTQSQQIQLEIWSLEGKKIMDTSLDIGTGVSQYPINLRGVGQGMYLLRLKRADGKKEAIRKLWIN